MYSVSSESAVIASLLFHPDFYYRCEQLTPHHFTDSSNVYLYYAVSELIKRGVTNIDLYDIAHIITQILEEREDTRARSSEAITLDKIRDFIDIAPSISRATGEEYDMVADDVLLKAFKRDVTSALTHCQSICRAESREEIERRIYETIDNVLTSYSTNKDLKVYKDVVDKIWSGIVARHNGEAKVVEFPFPALNQYVVMEPGELICFTGAAKSGKSAMLLTCAVDLLKHGHSVLYIDSELSEKLFTIRLLSHLSGVKFSDVRDGAYSPEEGKILDSWREWMKKQKFIHIYMPIFDEASMCLAAKKAKHMIDIDCIIVDYLKSTSAKDEAFSVYAEMGRVSDALKNKLCGDLNLIGLTGAQATASGKIADSARIARSVSTVVSITDKTLEEMEQQGSDCGNKKLRVVFNRNGDQMNENEWIDMAFDGPHITYRQASKQHEEAAAKPY